MERTPPVVHEAFDAKALRRTGLSMLLAAARLLVVMSMIVHTSLTAFVVLVLVCVLMLVLTRSRATVTFNMVMVRMSLVSALLVMTMLHMLHLLRCACGSNCAPVLAFNVEVCHNLVHAATKYALQRHLQKPSKVQEVFKVDVQAWTICRHTAVRCSPLPLSS